MARRVALIHSSHNRYISGLSRPSFPFTLIIEYTTGR